MVSPTLNGISPLQIQNRGLPSFAFPHTIPQLWSPNFPPEHSSFHHSRHLRRLATIASNASSLPKFTAPLQYAVDDSSNPNSPATSWSEFSRNVSGEWDGFGADFSSEGRPVELPESVVPEAYREWEVKVYDWQTQCPTDAKPAEQVFLYKSIKLLPTVGCEADAATRYSISERSVGGVNNAAAAFAYHSSGCYVAVWPVEDRGRHKLVELEHCLISPRDRESRVRIIQVINLNERAMVLQGIRVFCEQWYGPFRNGEQLGGCSIRESGFASTPFMSASEITGIWEGPKAGATFNSLNNEVLQELVDDGTNKSVRDGCNVVLLPKQLWCSLKQNKDGEIHFEAGWLFDKEHAITSSGIFSSTAELKEVLLASETGSSESVQ